MSYTIRSPKHTNHLLHLILTMATCGFWGFVWAGVTLYNAMTKEKTTVSGVYSTGPYASPYAVGPGAPVGALNPHPPTPGVATPVLRPEGVATFRTPPYVGYASDHVTNMATPPPVPPVPPVHPEEWAEPVLCGIDECTYRTPWGPRMTMHREKAHPAASAQ